jgi:hypothetical protein
MMQVSLNKQTDQYSIVVSTAALYVAERDPEAFSVGFFGLYKQMLENSTLK